MLLPNASAAIISPEKLRDYLLSQTYPIGRYKAAFFRSLGYEADGWETLEKGIRSLLDATAEEIGATDYGKKYVVTGVLTGPNGRSATLVTAWIILTGEDTTRFVTAYPGDEP